MLNSTNEPFNEQPTLPHKLISSHRYSDKGTPPKPVISFKASSILKYLIVAAFVLIMLNFLVIISYQLGFTFPARDKFYFDREDSLPTYFSSLILFIAASILSLIAFLKRKNKSYFANHWTGLAIIFLCLSIDEAVSFHEFLIEPLRIKFNLTGFLRFPWVIAGGLFLLIFIFSYLRFFLALSKNMKALFFASGAIYVLGAIGFEMIGGYIYKGASGVSDTSLTYMLVMTIEETLEMSGILLFIFTLLLYIKSYAPKINLFVE